MFIDLLLKDNNITNITIYGSFCYGTFCPKQSDIDLLCIIDNKESFINTYWSFIKKQEDNDNEFSVNEKMNKSKNIEIHFYTKEEWLNQIQQNTEFVYEVYFSKYNLKCTWDWKGLLKKDIFKIRKEFSSKASNSFVKCKKKILIESKKGDKEKNIYIGKKSLWHSLKIFTFGIELIEFNTIHLKNQTLLNHYYNIMNLKLEDIELWNQLNINYKPLFNQLHSEFKLLSTKPL